VYAHPELDAPLLRHTGVALVHAALNLDSAPDRIHNACELHEHAVARGLNDPSAMFGDLRVDKRLPMSFELGKRALFIGAHKAAIPGDIGRQDRCEPSLNPFGGCGHEFTMQMKIAPMYLRRANHSRWKWGLFSFLGLIFSLTAQAALLGNMLSLDWSLDLISARWHPLSNSLKL
jgi:hypothetical protein